MANRRQHFTLKDFELFFSNPDWENELKKKVNFKTTTIFKDRYERKDCTFLAGLISTQLDNGLDNSSFKNDIARIFNELDSKGYTYTGNDLKLPFIIMADVDEKYVDSLIFLFEKLEDKGIKLKANKKAINESFSRLHHPKFDKYLLENDLVSNKDMENSMSHYLQILSNYNNFVSAGVFAYIGKEEKAKEKAKYIEAMEFLKVVINSTETSDELLKGILEHITPDTGLSAKFIHKNKLEINMFNDTHYFLALEYKPKEIYTADKVEIIELIEKKLGINYLDRTGRNPKEVLLETTKKTGRDYNSTISIHYSDGTSLPLNKPVKYE